jgi:hypothetical protein
MLFLNHKRKSDMGLVKLEAYKKINRRNEMLSLDSFLIYLFEVTFRLSVLLSVHPSSVK